MTSFLPRLEWEVLQDEWNIINVSEPPFLKDSCEKIELGRDEDCMLIAVVSGRHDTAIEPPDHLGPPGSTVVPFQILGTDRYETNSYVVEECYVLGVNNQQTLTADEKYITQSTVRIRCHRATIDFRSTDERQWLTEWYLNAPDARSYACRSTKRKDNTDYSRRRYGDSDKVGDFRGSGGESNTVDHIVLESDGRKCIVHAVPEDIGPTWARKLGIEYRREFGWVPEKSERDGVGEIVGFVLGRHLLNIGSTEYNTMGYPILAYAYTPWGDARSQSQTSQWTPLRPRPYGKEDTVEAVLSRLLAKYLDYRDQYGLQEALWRYWIANSLPVGTSVPLFANGVEIMAHAWFANNKSASKGVYMEKKEWDKLLGEYFEDVSNALKGIEHADRMLSRMKSSFQMGANERLSVFFEEIGLKLGQPELDAIKARNKMIHSSIGLSAEEIKSAIQHTHAYRTLFHRVFLRLLEYDGAYVDYTSVGWKERSLDEPTSSDSVT